MAVCIISVATVLCSSSTAQAQQLYWIGDVPVVAIYRSNLNGCNTIPLVVGDGILIGAKGLDIDSDAGKIYWSTSEGIYKSNIDGTNIEFIISTPDLQQSHNDYAVNVVIAKNLQKIYWSHWVQDCDPTGGRFLGIRRANLDGTGEEVIIPDICRPRGIDIDEINGKVYWTNVHFNSIYRANLDGTSVQKLLEFDKNPEFLQIDAENSKMYWNLDSNVNFPVDAIMRSNLDGTNVETVIDNSNDEFSYINKFELYNGHIYFFTRISTEPGSPRQILRVDLDGGNLVVLPHNFERNIWNLVIDPVDRNLVGNIVDCQPNNVPDDCEILDGSSSDCNNNIIPDECEITDATALDCNSNDIPDECEVDCNENSIPDDCDIANGTSEDCSGNGVPTECERDCNNNSIADDCEPHDDCNNNGVPDMCESDCNNNGVADECDIESDPNLDLDVDGTIDACAGTMIFMLFPTTATGEYSISENVIQLPHGGQRVWIDILYKNWAPDALKSWKLTIDTDSYVNNIGAPLVSAEQACTITTDCESTLGMGSHCSGELNIGPNFYGANRCSFGYYTEDRADEIPEENGGPYRYNLQHNGFSAPIFQALRATNATPSKTDPGFSVYGGTLVIDVPNNAAGKYIIDFVQPDESTAKGTTYADIEIISKLAVIDVAVSCCMPEGVCQNEVYQSECEAVNGIIVPFCTGDCNLNSINDTCDIAFDLSADCDGDMLPDDCEPDCNDNSFADDCDFANGISFDCNNNSIPDECDIDNGISLDLNNDAIPDECGTMNRYILFDINFALTTEGEQVNATSIYAARVTLTDVNGFGQFNGQVRWLGPPQEFTESGGDPTTFFASQLQCEPYFADWSTSPQVNAYGSDIVPESVYNIQLVDETCTDLDDPTCYSLPQSITTATWGDVIAPFSASSLQQPDIADVLALVDKWLGSSTISTARGQLQADVPNPAQGVSIADILKAVDAWLGTPYPFDGPQTCSP